MVRLNVMKGIGATRQLPNRLVRNLGNTVSLYLEFLKRRSTFLVAIVDTHPRVHVGINQFIVVIINFATKIIYEPMDEHWWIKIAENGTPSVTHP